MLRIKFMLQSMDRGMGTLIFFGLNPGYTVYQMLVKLFHFLDMSILFKKESRIEHYEE